MDYVKHSELSQITITCKEHDKVLANGVRQLLKDEYFIDANVSYNDASFKVHRLILAVFLPTLKEHMNDIPNSGVTRAADNLQILNLDYVAGAAEDVQALIEFVYFGKVTIPKERVKHVSQLASDLNVDSLVKAVGEYWQTEEVHHIKAGEVISYDEELDAIGTGRVTSDIEPSSDIKDSTTMMMSDCEAGFEVMSNFNETMTENKFVTGIRNDDTAKEVPNTPELPTFVCSQKTQPEGTPSLKTQSVIPVISTSLRLISTDNLETTVKRRVRQRNRVYTTETDVDSEEEEDVSLSEQEAASSDGSDWTPKATSRDRKTKPVVRKTTRRATQSFPSITSNAKEKKAIERFCKEVLQTWEEVKKTSKLSDTIQSGEDEAGVSNKKQNRAMKSCVDLSTAKTDLPTCEKCSRKFITVRSMHRHSKICGKQQLFVCDVCGHRAENRATHRQHLRQVHGQGLATEKSNVFLKCPQCPFTCNAKYKLRGHFIRRHTAERKHKCPECEYSAMYRGEIERHVSRSHRKEIKFVCEICGSRYQMKGSLNQHMLIKHQGIKPHKCDYCRKEYTNKHGLNIHIQTKHTNDVQRHVCNICGNSYIKRWGLQYHMRHAHGMSLEPLRKPYLPRHTATAPPSQEDLTEDIPNDFSPEFLTSNVDVYASALVTSESVPV